MRIEKTVRKNLHEQIHTQSIFFRQQSFSFFPAHVATRKINFVGGCTSAGPNDCNDTKSNWVAFASKKMHLEQIFLIVCNENWRPI